MATCCNKRVLNVNVNLTCRIICGNCNAISNFHLVGSVNVDTVGTPTAKKPFTMNRLKRNIRQPLQPTPLENWNALKITRKRNAWTGRLK